MQRAKVELAVAWLLLPIAYVFVVFVLPRLHFRIGFQAGLVMQGVIILVTCAIAGVVSCRVMITTALALYRSESERTLGGYATFALGTLLTVVVLAYLILSVVVARQ